MTGEEMLRGLASAVGANATDDVWTKVLAELSSEERATLDEAAEEIEPAEYDAVKNVLEFAFQQGKEACNG